MGRQTYQVTEEEAAGWGWVEGGGEEREEGG